MICGERLLQHLFVFLLLNRKHSLSQQWIMLLLIYAEVQFDLKCSVNLISLILHLFSFLLLFKCEQTFQIVVLCNDCLPNFQHVCVPTWLDKDRSISTLLARFCRYGLLRSKKIFSAIRLKYNWHKRFLPNARNVKSCPAVTLGVIIVELSLFRMANEKEKRKDNIKITFVWTPSH